MKPITITTNDSAIMQALRGQPGITNLMLCEVEPEGHRFTVGQKCVLHGMQAFPEFNGDEVEIEGYRANDSGERCYYIKGRCNEVMNWVYEKRLRANG